MIPSFRKNNFLKIDNVVPIFILVAFIFTALSVFIIYFSSITSKTSELKSISQRMQDNIRYKNGYWDLSYLNSDPILPGSNPHYIIANDGYVIERWRPIKGFLDTSDFAYLLQFRNPQTLSTPAQESWRLLSQSIMSGQETIGVINVARFIGEADNIEIIDKRLRDDLSFVSAKIKVNGNEIDASGLDLRQTRYDISIKIVNTYNEVIAKTNNSNSIDRVPNYIDPSYVADELEKVGTRTVKNETTGEPFLIMSSVLQDDSLNSIGLLVSAVSVADLYNLLKAYISVMIILSVITVIILKIAVENSKASRKPTSIRFSVDDATMYINDNRIVFPDNSHQLHILSCLFKDPEKSWSAQEIATAFHETDGNIWRRIYDAMLVVNKKADQHLDDKLVIIKDKKFLINPAVLDAIIS